MRWWSWFVFISFLSCALQAAETTPPAADPAPVVSASQPTTDKKTDTVPPTADASNSEYDLQISDWKNYPDFRQIDQLSVLFHKSTTNYQKGVAVFVPEWQQTGSLIPLATRLNQEGFDTVILFPLSEQLSVNPGDEKAQDAIKKLSDKLSTQLASIDTTFPTTTGHRLIITQGSSAIWLAGMITNKTINPPDALVLLNGVYPDKQANQLAATQFSTMQIPVLDLYQSDLNAFLNQATQQRQDTTRESNKLNWRQRSISQINEAGRQMISWMISLGWK